MDKNKVFITSDLHFYHRNIIKYCNRPYSMDDDGIRQMNEDILKKFDELPDDCIVINNGDFCLNPKVKFEDLKQIAERMKGKNRELWIIMGNHDRKLHKFIKGDYKTSYDLLLGLGFDKIFPFPILIDNYLFSHEPVYLKPGSNLVNVYGHVHDNDIDENYFNRNYKNRGVIKPLGKFIDISNYKNVCWDKNHKFLKFTEL